MKIGDSPVDLDRVTIPPDLPISQAIAKLDAAGTGALMVSDEHGNLVGMLTDGDIRRAILRRHSLDGPSLGIAKLNPITARSPLTRAKALERMIELDINHLPIVDDEGRVLDFLLRRDLVPDKEIEVSAVIMAGGFGKRLRPLTDNVPKPMLPVGDTPLLERTIVQLRNSGIKDISLTTHYRAQTIVDHFGNGDRFDVHIDYLLEQHPLGTVGGLRGLKCSAKDVLVMNGDILTGIPIPQLVGFHRSHKADITIGVRIYEIEVPYGVIECDGVDVKVLREKPRQRFFINAGTYVINPRLLSLIPEGRPYDMTDLIQVAIDSNLKVISFPIREYWLDIGRPEDYAKAQDDVLNGRI